MSQHPAFFPLWVVVTHFLNIFFMLLLTRSGLEVLSAFPKLYWHDDTPPGRQWLRLSKKTFAADSRRPWTTLDEEVSWSPVVALHVVFYAMDDKGLTEGEGRYGFFYGSIPMYLAGKPQTLLALDMNGAPLPAEHGAPVRLRIETQLGFKMVKWIKAIEFVDDVAGIGQGQGGWREDQQYYANAAGI